MTNELNESDKVEPAPISVSDRDLDDLRRRLARTRWPDRETVPDGGPCER